MNPLIFLPFIGDIVKRVIPDKDQQQKAIAKLNEDILAGDIKDLEKRADVIIAEANSESWLARNWRPIMMLLFASLVTSAWFGFVPANMPEYMITQLFDIIKIGIGGYVGGRSIEKVATTISNNLKK